eukprot:6173615-Pyramimonas_sp.AAC.1
MAERVTAFPHQASPVDQYDYLEDVIVRSAMDAGFIQQPGTQPTRRLNVLQETTLKLVAEKHRWMKILADGEFMDTF